MKQLFFLLLLLSASECLFAQQVSGKVVNEDGEQPIANASVLIKGTSGGTLANAKGQFTLSAKELPVTLIVSAVNFGKKEAIVNDYKPVEIRLVAISEMLQGVIIGAKWGKPVAALDAPVSVEKFGLKEIRNNPATSYYDLIGSAKGVDVTTSSFTFKTFSTRGFNTSGSSRVNQLVDGMDNQTPGLNFYVGNFAGLTELDVESIEVLPGASSALYGPGGMNGTILINSKNPFQYQGLSLSLKGGVTNVDKSQRDKVTDFHDFALRYAKAFNRFAFKVGAQYIQATDWLAHDESNYTRTGDVGQVVPGDRNTDPNYDGVNIYGDETSADIYPFLAGALGPNHPFAEHIKVSRTGYAEKDVVEPETKNIKLSAALHYKLSPNTEAQLMGFWGTGNTVYTGNNRYVLKGINIGQYKLEVKNTNWFLRGYTTQEDAGDAYSATAATQVLNEMWKRSYDPTNVAGSWYPQFVGAYLTTLAAGADKSSALQAAREFADRDRPLPGSAEFAQMFKQARSISIPNGGRFYEKSQLWCGEGQYNFSHLIPFAELVVGADVKQYVLNSKGTIFIDSAAPIKINEWGAYAQLTKNVAKRITLSASGRYDKNQDFDGKFTPRFTALIRLVENNNLRLSYQTAYRFAANTQKYILLNVGSYTIGGGLQWIGNFLQKPVMDITNSPAKPWTYIPLKPESMHSFEVGYKSLLAQKLLIDAYAYFGSYRDFYGRNVLLEVPTGKIYSSVVNSSTEVKTHGFGLSLDYNLPQNFFFTLNGYSDVLTDVPSGFQTQFNTPKYRANVGFGNSGIGKMKTFGFTIQARWQDAFYSEGDLASGNVDAFTTVDAQVHYKLPKQKVTLKIGGTNVFNHYYKNAYGNPEIGGLYYVCLGFGL